MMLARQLPKSTSCAARLLRRPCTPSLPWRYSSLPKRSNIRVFTSNPWLKREGPPQHKAQQQSPREVDLVESVKPESVQKPPAARRDEPPKTDALLTEQTVSNKEQRKADWAIMKEMARYLWPKVVLPWYTFNYGHSNTMYRMILAQK